MENLALNSNYSLAVSGWDISIIIFYLIGIVGIGLWAGMRQRDHASTGKEYFLAGGTLTWPIIGLALFSTNISTIHLVSFAQEGYMNGLTYGNFEWMAVFTLIIMALFFAPFYIRTRIYTLPDFLERRYSRPSRDMLAILSIISAIFIHIGFTLYTGAVVLQGLFGINIYVSIIGTAILTGIYTIVGGLMAVVVTESIQTIILLLGATIITAIAYVHVGGWSGLAEAAQTYQIIGPAKLTILRDASDPAGLPWYSVFLGYPIIGIWYWCTDQTIVQRVLGAKDENHARIGPLFASFIKILPVFIFVLPGLLYLALVQMGKFPGPPEGHTDQTYAYMINNLLPVGLRGIVAAALLAALMSTVSGALNSIATLFSFDIFKRWAPQTPDKKLLKIGRIVTAIGMLAAIVWSPFISHFTSIYQGCVALISYIAPPITAVFVLGVFWKRASATGAIVTLVTGSFLGLTVFLLDWFKAYTGWSIQFLMASFYLFVICVIIHIIVSNIKPHKHTHESLKLVWESPLEALKDKGWPILNYKYLSLLLIGIMAFLYVFFTYFV